MSPPQRAEGRSGDAVWRGNTLRVPAGPFLIASFVTVKLYSFHLFLVFSLERKERIQAKRQGLSYRRRPCAVAWAQSLPASGSQFHLQSVTRNRAESKAVAEEPLGDFRT